jgi:hypothetical protein
VDLAERIGESFDVVDEDVSIDGDTQRVEVRLLTSPRLGRATC